MRGLQQSFSVISDQRPGYEQKRHGFHRLKNTLKIREICGIRGTCFAFDAEH
jgi:hypothetical protein